MPPVANTRMPARAAMFAVALTVVAARRLAGDVYCEIGRARLGDVRAVLRELLELFCGEADVRFAVDDGDRRGECAGRANRGFELASDLEVAGPRRPCATRVDSSATTLCRPRAASISQRSAASCERYSPSRYITSERSTYFVPDVTVQPSCSRKCWNSSALPVRGCAWTSKSRNSVVPPPSRRSSRRSA